MRKTMIVCICHNVNSSTIQAAIEDGAESVEEIREQTKAASGCGKCLFKVNRHLQDGCKSNQCASSSVAQAI
jgi:bacterioferritin-associated ferredoxin